jgi:hypothetical protein
VIELTGAAARPEIDLAVRVTASQVNGVDGDGRVGEALGSPIEAAPRLARLPIAARALGIARYARGVLIAESARIGGILERTEVALRHRMARLENLRISDRERFLSEQLARIQPQAIASIPAVLEHAGAHLGAELAQRDARWDEQVQAASTPDELRAVASRIDEESVAESRRIAEETRLLTMGGVVGISHDLLFDLFSVLRHPEIPDELAVPPRGAPLLSPVAMLPSLTDPSPSAFAGELSGAGQWIAGLFRSVEARRGELRDKVRQRCDRVRTAAEAELLAAEPALLAALLETERRELSAAIDRRDAWLAAEVAKEQLAADAERAALRPLAAALDDARRAAHALAEWIGALEAPRAGIPSTSRSTP